MEELQELEQTKKLTPKQEMFCQEYTSKGIAGLAYSIAYGLNWNDPKDNRTARVNASKLLTNSNIKARVEEIREETRKNCIIDKQFLLEQCMAIMMDARVGTPEMKLNRDGKFVPTGNMIKDNKGANEAVKNMMTILGYNSTNAKVEVSGETKTELNIVTAKDVIQELKLNNDD